MPRRIRRDDTVVVIAGKDRGKTGTVLRVDPDKDRVFVEGLNMIKRHQRPLPGQTGPNVQSGVIEREGPIHISNVMLADPSDQKPTRVRTAVEDGKRLRIARRSGEKID